MFATRLTGISPGSRSSGSCCAHTTCIRYMGSTTKKRKKYYPPTVTHHQSGRGGMKEQPTRHYATHE
eukprot:934334-Prorocentrum_lima.AAC.1